MTDINALGRAELAALVVETLAARGIKVARNHAINWEDLAAWHDAEGYAHLFETFQDSAAT